jgi:hypothetical protein
MTWARFQEIVEHLLERRILQGKRTLFIVPKALHIYLWIDYWKNYGRGFDFQAFFDEIPTPLQPWFLQQFIYAHASAVACKVVRDILSSAGPFSQHTFLVSQAGTRFLNYLAEAEPSATLAVIERTFGTWPLEELKNWQTGRQDIVWALEKIAVWREYFLRAAHVLVKLALAENANYSNNSTGILLGLFMTGLGWAPTQASPEERFPIIEILLGSHDRLWQELGLKVCAQWLNTYGGTRAVGAEYQGLRPEVEFWHPKTWGEVFDAWRLVWGHLFTVTRHWNVKERRLANSTLIEAGAGLLSSANLANEVMETLFQLAEDSATDIQHFTRTVIQELKSRTAKMPKGIRGKLRTLDKKLTGDTFWGQFARYVLHTTWDEDYEVKGDTVKQLRQPSQRVQKLAMQVATNATLFAMHLPQFVVAEGHRLYEFGAKLAAVLSLQATVEAVVSAQLCALPAMQTQFIGGYFSGLKTHSPYLWEASVSHLLQDDTSRELGVAVVLWARASENIIRLLLDLFRQGHVQATAFSRLAWQAEPDNIPQVLVEEVLATLVNSAKAEALRVAIQLAHMYFFDKKQPRACDETVVFRLLSADQFFCRDLETMTQYYWRVVAKGFHERCPARALELLSAILSHPEHLWSTRLARDSTYIADEIVQMHPDETWTMVSSLLEADETHGLVSWLGDEFRFDDRPPSGAIRHFDPDMIMAWVLQNPATRIRKLLRCLPKTLDEKDGGRLTKRFLEAYGDDEQVADCLIGHFWSGGWMGPESAHRAGQRDKARQWLSENKSGKVLAWLYRYIESLTRGIEQSELREERGF